ncbi:sulfotransferase domain-containing protein [Phthorimaea operculella]|nr:sulfotransferase domain-containing protein [Phthorimaea operculella]
MEDQTNNYPLEINSVEPKLNQELMKYFTGEYTGFVRVGPKGYLFPDQFRKEAAKIYNMMIRPDDIFVATFPRSGTTWTQELVWMVANDLNYAGSDATLLRQRFPFLEHFMFIHPVVRERLEEENKDKGFKIRSGADVVAGMPSPRFIKTHLPLSLLPPTLLGTAKMVYVARDPRDAAVSFYHHNRLFSFHGYNGDFKTYWNFFLNDLIYYTPYFGNLKEAWECRNHPNMLFLFYEELCKDLPAGVRKVATFLNKELTEDQIARLCDHLSIENFKKNKSVNMDEIKSFSGMMTSNEDSFVRKGKAGGWRAYFDEEMMQQADSWMEKNLQDTDFRFPHLETGN